MYDLITIGDITIDLYFSGKDLTIKDSRFALAIGAKYSTDTFYDGLGGGAANVAINASSLGLNTAVVGKIGENSFKQIMLQKLIKKRVSTEFIIYNKDYFNLSTILVTPSGERTVIHHATSHNTIDLSPLQIKNLTNTKSVYIGHLPGVSLEERRKIIKHFQDRDITIYINFGLDDIEKHPKSLVDYVSFANILIINAYEFAAFLGIKKEKVNLSKNIAKKIGFNDKILIITDGAGGSYGYYQDKVYHQPIIKTDKIVDTNGVGDAFTSGFIASYYRDHQIETALLAGTKTAAKIIQKIGSN